MSAGTLMHPGRVPVRGFRFLPRPHAYLAAPLPPVVAGTVLRRGYNASRHPSKRFRFPKRPKPFLVVGGGGGVIDGTGPTGAATFVLTLQSGTKVVYSWRTDIHTSYDGTEQRESGFGAPRTRYEGSAFLVDGSSRDLRGTLQRAAASGSTFLLALPFEALTITADSPDRVVTVTSTAQCEWAHAGQRAVIVGIDGTVVNVVVQSSTDTTITIATADSSWALSFGFLASVGRAGGSIMPVVPVLLDPTQGFSRYPVGVDLWSLRAQSSAVGFSGVDSMGAGASIVTYTDGGPSPVADITDADLLIWDRSVAVDDTANAAMLSGAETVDLGALPFGIGDQSVPNWGRSVKLRSISRDDWAWFKAFTRHMRGRQGAFLLSTSCPDLVFDSLLANGIKVKSASIAGSGDYTSWFVSSAYARLAISTSDGAIQYATVTAVANNGDGTLSLTLDNSVSGTVTAISFAEMVRFERDEIEATWDGAVFAVDEPVVSTRDIIIPPARQMFDTEITMSFTYVFPEVPPATQEFNVTLGKVTKIGWTSDRTLVFNGINVSGGATHGQVVLILNENTSAFGLSFSHEDTSIPASHRFWNHGATNINAFGIFMMYRFNADVGPGGRWVQILGI